jgi:3-oxoacyl-[acyl-carrier-protein] synthase II
MVCAVPPQLSTACSSSATSVGEDLSSDQGGVRRCHHRGRIEALVTNGNLRAWEAMQALAHADPADPRAAAKRSRPIGLVSSSAKAPEHWFWRAPSAPSARRAYLCRTCGIRKRRRRSRHLNPMLRGRFARCAGAGRREVNPHEIAYLNAHGTATALGDVVRTNAIKRVFGSSAPALPVSSTKALHGHLMGATGAVEVIAAIMAMQEGVIPPTAHLAGPTRCAISTSCPTKRARHRSTR